MPEKEKSHSSIFKADEKSLHSHWWKWDEEKWVTFHSCYPPCSRRKATLLFLGMIKKSLHSHWWKWEMRKSEWLFTAAILPIQEEKPHFIFRDDEKSLHSHWWGCEMRRSEWPLPTAVLLAQANRQLCLFPTGCGRLMYPLTLYLPLWHHRTSMERYSPFAATTSQDGQSKFRQVMLLRKSNVLENEGFHFD